MKIVIKIISYIIAFILMLTILAGILIGITTKTVLSQTYVINKLEETNFYEKVQKNLLIKEKDYIEQSGLEELNIEKIFTVEQIKKDVNNLFNQMYRGKVVSLNENNIKQQLNNQLDKMNLTTAEKKEADQIFETVINTYSTEVTYGTYSQYLNNVPKAITKINNTISEFSIVMYILPIIFIVIILIINRKQIKIVLKYIGISLLANGILLIGINIYIKTNIDISNLLILNKASSDLIIAIITDILAKLNIVGIICTIIGFVGIVIGATYKKEKHKQKHS